ncbi:hypothetical protein A2X44_00015 [candidate division CPR3 bacterium GWF2_35_18]|uniref:Uncharacterized protein n=1 Tax=candidate division CPR3 bacterium GW2011_GWF2_35_18 TaxID=1618350 RepID=A0A0G0BL04_UNCC3|nr:MAG: hypothetical protein UR67_C0001G0002 [candidate division CPR3 bacterium GW2011_GWF2_35_18]KKP85884.1 MAG: hypothetical protein UR87_C0036G0008 [candidate division CPR3 bacterium GW2011_GWE2_35_7]OGB63310.1 MAG: hypothetical protein A2X44_00015 [candidate division CPR3 bacterium GWF2_35_18]OGB65621.1 MAG: hypothetical protein A2250_02495 [candidate division CPR3 bacterium RIFOXYA2_FULL_35_13]OGB77043.1 MAG: hypothetical protein A2476_00245 [candidate division CPR3 bacterium RIFOXYC2_FULL
MPQDLEKTESNITVKGIFIIPTIDEIKKRASEKEIAMLSKLIPNLKVSPFVSYPVLYQNESEKILCRILYGNYNYDAYLKFGRRSFNSFANSNIGKVMMSLFGNSPQKIIMNTQRLFDTVTKGIKIETKKISENKYSTRYYNDPYPLGGTEGVLYGGLEMLKLKNIDIKFIDHGNQDHEFIMSWQ